MKAEMQAVYRPEIYNQDILIGPKITSEEKAYKLARTKNQPLPYSIGQLSKKDLIDIASYNPEVTLQKYLNLKEKTFEQLSLLYPEISEIAKSTGQEITWDDLFFYATRGKIINAPNIGEVVDRYKKYKKISELGRGLIDSIFGNAVSFALATEPSELEDYIISFDENIGDRIMMISIGDRLGYNIIDDENYTPSEQLYDILVDFIKEKKFSTIPIYKELI